MKSFIRKQIENLLNINGISIDICMDVCFPTQIFIDVIDDNE